MKVTRQHLFFLFFFSFCFLLLVVASIRGTVFSDEGYILHSASRSLNGEVVYKDFHFVYTPLSVYAAAFSFLLFGESILSGRILMLLLGLVSAYVLYTITIQITKRKSLSCLSVLLYIAWGSLHTNFPWPVMFAIPTGLLSCLFLLQAREAKKRQNLLLFLAGSMIFLTAFAKQNFGAVMVIVLFIALVTNKRLLHTKAFLWSFAGIIIPIGFYTMYLHVTGSLFPFITDFYTYTWQRIVLEQTLTTPFIFGEALQEKLGKFFFYTAPFFISCFALFVDFKKKQYWFLSFFVLFFYGVGIRPTTDYIHLAPLLSLVGIPLTIIYAQTKKTSIQFGVYAALYCFVLLGLYTAFYKGYYRWQPPLSEQNQYLAMPKTYIFVDDFQKSHVERLLSGLRRHTNTENTLFIHGYVPLIYFISGQKNPTAFDLLEPTDFYKPYKKDIIAALETHPSTLILTQTLTSPVLGSYMKKEYNVVTTIDGWYLLKRK